MRLIDADAFIAELTIDSIECPGCPEPEFLDEFLALVASAPTVDAVMVKHGRWVDDGDPLTLVCGVCGYRVMRYNNTKFCPDCGARMDKEENDG